MSKCDSLQVSSREIANTNINLVRSQIEAKTRCGIPFYFNLSGPQVLKDTVTDMDNFPYKRFFRGEYDKPYPIVMEREAGWRTTNNKCYRKLEPCVQGQYPNNCFESPCSTVFPCYPKLLDKFNDESKLQVMLNRTCVAFSP